MLDLNSNIVKCNLLSALSKARSMSSLSVQIPKILRTFLWRKLIISWASQNRRDLKWQNHNILLLIVHSKIRLFITLITLTFRTDQFSLHSTKPWPRHSCWDQRVFLSWPCKWVQTPLFQWLFQFWVVERWETNLFFEQHTWWELRSHWLERPGNSESQWARQCSKIRKKVLVIINKK